jgi:cytidyltransferase-like protein
MKVLTVGTFDLIHSGHIRLIENCYKLAGACGKVVVGINSDDFVLEYKGRLPVIPLEDRVSVISSLLKVHKVVINNSKSLESLLIDEKPNILVVGSDWATKDYYSQIGVTLEWLYKNDILLVYTEYTKGISSSKIRKTLESCK